MRNRYGDLPGTSHGDKRSKRRRFHAHGIHAANELAVKKFLHQEINFLDIYDIIGQSMERHKKTAHPNLEEILAAEQETYRWIESRW